MVHAYGCHGNCSFALALTLVHLQYYCVYLTPVEGKKLVNQSTNLPCCLYAAGRARYMLTWQMHTTAFKVRLPGSPGRDPSLVDLLACPLPDHITNCNFVGDFLWQNNWTSMSSCYVRAKVCKCGVTNLVIRPQIAITPDTQTLLLGAFVVCFLHYLALQAVLVCL